MIRFLALGSLDLTAPGGRELRAVLARPKLLGLLAYLSAHAAGPFHRRDTLLALLWPEATDARARAALRQALYHLRNELGEGVLVGRGDEEVGLDATRFWSDVVGFEAALAAGDREGALELYRGDLLPGFFVPEASEFERWLEERRSALRRRAAAAACDLAEVAARGGNAAATGHWGRRALDLAPLDEGVVRTVLALLDRAGDRAGAVREYGAFSRRLDDQLGIEPAPETRSLVQEIAARSADHPLAAPAGESEAVPSGGRFAAPPLALDAPPPALVATPLLLEAEARAGVPGPARSLRWPLAAAAVLVLAVASALVLRGRTPALRMGRVAMGPFENRTGDVRLDAVGPMAADWTAGALRRANLVEVADPERTRQALLFAGAGSVGTPQGGVRIAAVASGARLVVSGSVDLVGDTLLLGARITDAERDVVLAQLDPVRALRSDPTPAIAELSSRVTGALGTITDARVSALAGAPRQPPQYEAYRAYVEGEVLFSRAFAPGQGSLHVEGLERYLQAFALDSTLVEALMRAAEAAAFLGRTAQAESLAAIVVGRRDELSPYSRRRLDLLVATLAGDPEERLRAARLVRETPLDLAQAALATNRPREAIAALTDRDGASYRRSVAALGWEWLDLFAERLLATAYHAAGEYDAELRVARAARTRHPSVSSAVVLEVQPLAALGQADEVDRVLDTLLALPTGDGPPPGSAMLIAAAELRAHGGAAAARRVAGRAVAWFEAGERAGASRGQAPLFRALALFLAERFAEARVLADSMARRDPVDPNALGMLAVLAARRGDSAEVRVRRAALDALPAAVARRAILSWRAGVLAWAGEQAEALAVLREAVAGGRVPLSSLHRDPVLEPLWGTAAFRVLIRPRE